jgi:hypothetical protein
MRNGRLYMYGLVPGPHVPVDYWRLQGVSIHGTTVGIPRCPRRAGILLPPQAQWYQNVLLISESSCNRFAVRRSPPYRDQGPYAGLAEPLADGSAGEAGSRLSVRLSAFLRRRPSADAGGPPRCARTSGPESWRLRPWGAFSRVQRRSLSSSPRSALYPGFPTSYRKSGGPAAASAETLLHPLRLTHRDVPPRESDAPAHDWRVCGSSRPRRREAVPARCKVPNPRHAAACQAVVCGAVGCHERLPLPFAAEISCVPLFGQRYLIDMVGPGR